MVVYLWVTGDTDWIKKCKTMAAAKKFKSAQIRMGYYATILTDKQAEPYKKFARW